MNDKEKAIERDLRVIVNQVRHAFNQGYELGRKEEKEKNEHMRKLRGKEQ